MKIYEKNSDFWKVLTMNFGFFNVSPYIAIILLNFSIVNSTLNYFLEILAIIYTFIYNLLCNRFQI